MPTIRIDVDIFDVIDELSDYEIDELINYLIENNLIKDNSKVNEQKLSYSDIIWLEMINKLRENRLQLNDDEIETIEKISSRFL